MTAEPSVRPSGRVPQRLLQQPAADLVRWCIGGLLALLWCTAMLVAWRRVAGALSQPLHPATMLVVGMLIVMVAVAVRLLARYFPLHEKGPRVVLWLSPTLTILALGAALSLPATPLAGLIGFWLLVAAEEYWAWRPLVRRARRGTRAERAVRVDPLETPLPHPPAEQSAESAPSPPPPAAMPSLSPTAMQDGDVLQQLTRSQGADGSEELCGWLRMPLGVRQRTGSLHVAFCPPFPRTPLLEVEQLAGPESRIKTAQLLPHGVRLDLKLQRAAGEPVEVVLQFSAKSPVD